MPYAWISPPGFVKDVAQGVPSEIYAPSVAAMYTELVPQGTVNGAKIIAGVWVNPDPILPPEVPYREPVPAQVTLFQARTQLRRMGVFAAIDEYVEANKAANPEGWEAWNYANNCYRNSGFVVSLAALLSLTPEQVDAAFIAAGKIEV